jgi:PAS domain S-box-containing protein
VPRVETLGTPLQMTKRVLIADDNGAMRRAIRSFLEQQPGIEICAQTAKGLETVHAAVALRPDLLILDLRMPELNGVEIASLLKKNLPDSKIILFTMYQDALQRGLANAIGASVVVSKAEGLSVLAREVRALLGIPKEGADQTSSEDKGLPSKVPSELLMTALRDSEERFRSTFEQSAVGLALVARDGRWLRVNRKLCEIIGYSHGELHNMTEQDIGHPEDHELDLAQMKRIEAGEIESYSMEKRYIRRDGQIASLHLTVNAVRNEGGKLKYCVRVMEEGKHRTNAQVMVAQTLSVGRVASSHLELMSKRWSAPLTHCSRDLRYLWVNQQYADWLHKPVDRIVGRPIRDVIGKGAFETLLPRFEQVLGGEDVAYQAEATYDKIGRRHISAAYKPTLDSNGKTEGWVALVEDVTEAANEPGDSVCRNRRD